MRKSVPWLLAVIAALTVGVDASRMLGERNIVARLPPAVPQAPNVLLIVLDTVRADSLSLYGYAKPTTPQLARFARDAVTFTSALSTAPWTLPSHASLFTGRWPHELSTDWTSALDNTYPTIAEALTSHGYLTAGFLGNVIYGSAVHGLDRGFTHYEDFPPTVGQALLSSSLGKLLARSDEIRYGLNYHRVLNRRTAGEVNQAFLSWLPAQPSRPFFAFLNYMDAHEPYLPPAGWAERFGPARRHIRLSHTGIDAFHQAKWRMSESDAIAERAEYDGAIAYMDDELGQLFATLKQRGLFENTIVIVTADHGEQFGEHRLFSHANSLYMQLLHVPLVIRFGTNLPHSHVVNDTISLRDIPNTIVELTGIGAQTSFPGASLSRYWRQASDAASKEELLLSEASRHTFDVQPWYPLAQGGMTSVASGGYHYIRMDNGREELYAFTIDPEEKHDLSSAPGSRDVLERLRRSVPIGARRSENQTGTVASASPSSAK